MNSIVIIGLGLMGGSVAKALKNKNHEIEILSGAFMLMRKEALDKNQLIVTNSRHYDILLKSLEEIIKVQNGIDQNLSGDLLAIDLRQALYYLGEITGKVSNDDLLGNIFANFCIGK